MTIRATILNALLGIDIAAESTDAGMPVGLTLSTHVRMSALDGNPRGIWLEHALGVVSGNPDHCKEGLANDAARAQAAAELCHRYINRDPTKG
jgi:hypothetical protein